MDSLDTTLSIAALLSIAHSERLWLCNQRLCRYVSFINPQLSEKRSSSRPKTKGKKELTLHGASFAPAPSEEEFGKLKTVKVDHELSSSDLADIAEEYGHPRDSEWEHLNGFMTSLKRWTLLFKVM